MVKRIISLLHIIKFYLCCCSNGWIQEWFYYADKNILYIIENNNIICKEELNLPAYNGGNSVPYAPKIFVTDQYIALHTLAGVCLLDKEGNTITDEYTVAKIDAITDNIALAEYNADYVEVLDLPTLTSQGLFKARDSYVAYPVNADSFLLLHRKEFIATVLVKNPKNALWMLKIFNYQMKRTVL